MMHITSNPRMEKKKKKKQKNKERQHDNESKSLVPALQFPPPSLSLSPLLSPSAPAGTVSSFELPVKSGS
jgi:hypothetical protein